jgi:hypothetical protein
MNNLRLTTKLHYGFKNLTFPSYSLTWQSPWPEPRLLFLSSLRNNLTAQIYSHKTIISNAYIQCQSSSYKNVQQQITTKYHPGLTTPVKTPLWQSLETASQRWTQTTPSQMIQRYLWTYIHILISVHWQRPSPYLDLIFPAVGLYRFDPD